MPDSKTDRRIRRTRQLLQEALVALMREKDYGRITIQDIVERANVGRSTFYAHYQDKEDLLLRGVAGIAHGDGTDRAAPNDAERRKCSEPIDAISTIAMFTHVKENGPLRTVMHGKTQERTIHEKGTAFLYENIKAQLQQFMPIDPAPAVPISLVALYLTGGLMSLVQWWVENDMPQSPTEMDALFQQIAMPGVSQTLRKPHAS